MVPAEEATGRLSVADPLHCRTSETMTFRIDSLKVNGIANSKLQRTYLLFLEVPLWLSELLFLWEPLLEPSFLVYWLMPSGLFTWPLRLELLLLSCWFMRMISLNITLDRRLHVYTVQIVTESAPGKTVPRG